MVSLFLVWLFCVLLMNCYVAYKLFRLVRGTRGEEGDHDDPQKTPDCKIEPDNKQILLVSFLTSFCLFLNSLLGNLVLGFSKTEE